MKKRRFLILGFVVVAGTGIAAYDVYRKLPLLKLLDETYSTTATPNVYLVPEPEIHITPSEPADFAVQTFLMGKVRISVPSNLVSEVKENGDSQVTVVTGPGKKMVALVSDREHAHGEMIKEFQRKSYPFYDQQALRSSYDFMLATMQATPVGISILTSWDSVVGSSVLLSLKHGETGNASVIRPMAIGTLKAIQVGDADKGDEIVNIFLFPGNYRKINLYFRAYTSAEIRSVLESLVQSARGSV